MHRSLVSLVLLTACGAPAAGPTMPPAPRPTDVALDASTPALADGVVAIEPFCSEGADEACNALDDDCDGLIDEGCEGALSGPVVAAVAWSGAADVDLVLVAPDTTEPARTPSGGGCTEPGEPAIERAAIAALAEGAYRVELVRAACGDEAPVTASVTLAVNGRTLGTFNRPLASGERAPVLTVELAPR